MKTKLTQLIEEQEKIFTERGADMEHKGWAKWQNHIMTKLFRISSDSEEGLTLTIAKKYWEKWKREINTPYEKLSEEEKERDREQVLPYLPLIRGEKVALMEKIIETAEKLKEKNKRIKVVHEKTPEKYKEGYESAISDIEQELQKTMDELE